MDNNLILKTIGVSFGLTHHYKIFLMTNQDHSKALVYNVGANKWVDWSDRDSEVAGEGKIASKLEFLLYTGISLEKSWQRSKDEHE